MEGWGCGRLLDRCVPRSVSAARKRTDREPEPAAEPGLLRRSCCSRAPPCPDISSRRGPCFCRVHAVTQRVPPPRRGRAPPPPPPPAPPPQTHIPPPRQCPA